MELGQNMRQQSVTGAYDVILSVEPYVHVHKGGISRTFIYAFLLCRIFLTCIWFIYMLNFNISVCVYMSSDCIDLLQITAVSPSSVSCDTEHKSTTRHSWKRSIHARRTSPSMTSSTCKAQRGSHTVKSCGYGMYITWTCTCTCWCNSVDMYIHVHVKIHCSVTVVYW